jgi:hypothetical protein
MLTRSNCITKAFFLCQLLIVVALAVEENNAMSKSSDEQEISTETVVESTSESDDSSEGSGDMILLGKAVLLLAALKLTGVVFLYFVWRKIAPIVMPRRNVDISEGPTLRNSSVWDWLDPGSEDAPEVLDEANLRYKGVLYVRVAVDENVNDDEGDEPQTEV